MGNAMNVPDWAHNAFQTFGVVDHFTHYVSADEWTTVASDAGAAVDGDGKGGLVTITASDGTEGDNDETYLKQTQENFLFVADKPIYFGGRIQYTEANTDDANIAVGLKDAVAANSILDDGGGPAASYSGAVIFKADGDTTWSFETSVGGTQTTNQSSTTAGGSAFQNLEIFIEAHNATQLKAIPKVDGKELLDSTTGAPILHYITIGSATEMQAFFGVKNGDTNLETLVVDTAIALQKV